MNKIFFLFITTVIGVIRIYGQANQDARLCYIDKISDSSSVFTKLQIGIQFKGGDRKFQIFLLKNIDFEKFIPESRRNAGIYTDTARVKFVISRNAIMSNLTVNPAKSKLFQEEIYRVIRQSSCEWIPDNYSGRQVNGWIQLDVFYKLDSRGGKLSSSVNFKVYNYPTE